MTSDNIETLTWKIDDYSHFQQNVSPNSVPNGDFYFWITPNDAGFFQEDCTTVVINRVEVGTENQNVEWSISIIDRDGLKSQILFTKTLNENPTCGGMYFIDSNYLMNPANGLLVNDTLTIHCEIKTLSPSNSKESLERFESIVENKKLVENFESLLHNHKHSDVVCVVGVGKKEFKLHKNILCARSPVFAAMFDSDLSENKQNRVDIPDVEAEVFEELVRYIYTGKIPTMDQYAWELFVVSDKYQLDSLKDLCEKSLSTSLTAETATKVLTLADMHNATKLKANCVDYVTEHSSEVMATEGWKQMIKQRMELVIELYQRLTVKYEKK